MLTVSMVNRRRFLKTVSAGSLVGVAGCTGSQSNESNKTTTQTTTTKNNGQSSNGETIRVGELHPQSPPFGSMGKGARNAMKLVANKLNQEGGIGGRQIEVFNGDTEVDPGTAREEARRLVENHDIDVLIGGISGAVGLALSDFAASHNLPLFTIGSSDALTGKDCQRVTFCYNYSSSMTTNAMAPWIVENSGSKGWIHVADYSWGNSFLNALRNALGDSAEVVNVTKTELGSTDYSSYISQISASEADWVATGLSGTDAVNFLKQADQYGLKQNKDIYSPVNFYRTIRQGAGAAVVGTFVNVRYAPSYQSEMNNSFVSQFREAYGQPPNQMGEHVWTAMHAYSQAVTEAGSINPDDVIGQLEKITFTSPMEEEMSFRACDHRAIRDVHLGEVVQSDKQDWPSLKVTKSVSGEDVMRPCDETGCNF